MNNNKNNSIVCEVVISAVKQNKAKERQRGTISAMYLRTASLRRYYFQQSPDSSEHLPGGIWGRGLTGKGQIHPITVLSSQGSGSTRNRKESNVAGTVSKGEQYHTKVFSLYSQR